VPAIEIKQSQMAARESAQGNNEVGLSSKNGTNPAVRLLDVSVTCVLLNLQDLVIRITSQNFLNLGAERLLGCYSEQEEEELCLFLFQVAQGEGWHRIPSGSSGALALG